LVKKKKKDKHTIDLGGQELIRDDKSNSFIRKNDGSRFRFADYGNDRHLEKEYNSILQNYFARNLLDPFSREHNSKRYWAGQKYENMYEKAGIRQRITASLKENLGNGTKEDAVVNSLHSLSEFRWIDKEVGTSSKILWKVIINNNPAKKDMNNLREALDKLIKILDF
tara:strand:+ start:582 stop:1085 length:504 start_codon:yes stop_codon:yes gene_type:complete